MKWNLALPALSLVLLSSACRTTQSNLKDAVGFRNPPDIKSISCDKGDLAYFVMKEAPGLIQSDFKLEVPRLMDAQEMLVRLEVCSDGDELRLKRVIFGSVEVADEIEVGADAKIQGLSEAVFNEDYSTLDILVPYGMFDKYGDGSKVKSDEAFFLHGSAKGGALATIVSNKGGPYEYSKDRLLNFAAIGKLEYAEPTKGDSCDARSDVRGIFKLGTATFQWKGKQITGTSGGAAPLLCSLTVTDSAKQLGSKANVPVTVEFPFDGGENYQFKNNHHSVCDSFRLVTPGAVYAVTASALGFGGGECPEPVKGAPVGVKEGTKFSFQYGKDLVEGLSKTCGHPTRSCP